tara:strand:- start:616 stop:1197 length:582 start_codon:yes stop_codon:yes gene_type:complete
VFYHTALKNKSVTYRGIKETVRFEQQNGIMLKHNFVSDGLAVEFNECDVLYAEPPYSPSGLKVFNERAEIDNINFKNLIAALSKILNEWTKPVYLIMSKTDLVKLPSADVIVETTLNGNAVSMGVWNENCPIVLPSAELVCQELGSRYKCMGDFACGYGNSVKNFLIGGGQRFVASDYDGKCVTIISRQINKL